MYLYIHNTNNNNHITPTGLSRYIIVQDYLVTRFTTFFVARQATMNSIVICDVISNIIHLLRFNYGIVSLC